MLRLRILLPILLAVAAVVGVQAVNAAPACTITWDGPATGSWTTLANWSTNVLPGPSDHVCILAGSEVTHSSGTDSILTLQAAGALKLTGGTLTLTSTSDDSNAARFDLGGGTLAGAGRLVISGSSAWTGGSMTGTGTTRVQPAATLTQSGSASVGDGRTLENAGAIVMNSSSSITSFGPGASLVHNLSGATIRKTTSTATARIDPPLDNDGSVASQAGQLLLDGGGGESTGDYGLASAAGTVALGGGTHTLGDGARLLDGAAITAGTVTIADGAVATVAGAGGMSGGTLRGTGRLEIPGTFAWSGGSMTDAGVTAVLSSGALTQSGSASVGDGRTLENAGAITMTSSSSITSFGPGPSLVHNLSGATIRKTTSTATARIDPPLDNDGSVASQAGQLLLDGGGGTSTGDYGLASAAGTVALGGGTHTLGDGARLLDGAAITAGTVRIADGATATVAGADAMSGGTLDGTGTLDIAGGLAWSGGSMSDAGLTRVLGSGSITQSGSASIGNGRTLENAGTITMTSSSSITSFGPAAVLMHNLAAGTIRKTTSAATARIDPPLDNDGAVESTAGALNLDGGSGAEQSSGSFGASGATGNVDLAGGTHVLGNGASLRDGVRIGGGTVNVAGGATAAAAGAVAMTGGTLGGTGTFTISGNFAWSGGSMREAGTTRVLSGGTVTHSGSSSVGDGRTFENAGLLALTSSSSLTAFGPAAPLVHNLSGGTIRRTTSATGIRIDAPVDNDGALESTSGNLDLSGGSGSGASTGTFGAPGAAGTVTLASGTHALGNGAVLRDGTRISNATVNVPSGATATASGLVTMAGGTLGDAGTFAITGTFSWTNGTMAGAGITSVAPGATLKLDGFASLSTGRTLTVAGLMDVTGDRFVSGSFSTPEPLLDVAPGGTVRKTAGPGDATLFVPVRNRGTMDSTSGRLLLDDGAPLPDTGRFTGASETAHVAFDGGTHVLASSVQLDGWVEIDSSTVEVPDGATLAVDDHLLQTAGVLGGAGTVNVTGTLKWTGGSQQGPGTTTVAPAGLVSVEAACSVSLSGDRHLNNAGTLRLLGRSDVDAFGDAQAVIENTGLLQIDDTDNPQGCGGGSGIFGDLLLHNTGTVEKIGGTGSATLDGVVDNDGVMRAVRGELALTSTPAVSQTGSFTGVAPDGTLAFANGVFALGPGATLDGLTLVRGAQLLIPEGTNVPVGTGDTMRLEDGGTIGGAGDLTIAGTLLWKDGSQDGPGTTTIAPGGQATIGGAQFDFAFLNESRALVNRGTLTVADGGALETENGSSILNAGTLELRGNGQVSGFGGFGFGFSGLVHNTGLLIKPDAGDAAVGAAVDNDGIVRVSAGTLALQSLLNLSQFGTLTGGTFEVHAPPATPVTLKLPTAIRVNGAHLVLDGASAGVVSQPFPTAPIQDAIDTLTRNGGNGRLELTGPGTGAADGAKLTTAAPLDNAGIIRIGRGGRLESTGAYRQSGGLTQLTDDTARLTATGATVEVSGGRFGGRGSAGPELAATGGALEPGFAGAGALQLDKLTMGPAATLRVRPAAGAFGTVVVPGAGAAGLAGTLAIATVPGFDPDTGTDVPFLTAGSRSGTFATVTGAGLPGGRNFDVVYGPASATLHVNGPAKDAAVSSPVEPTPPATPAPVAASPGPAPTDATAGPTAAPDPGGLVALRGTWVRRAWPGTSAGTLLEARQAGAVLVQRNVRARRLVLRALTCRRCGAVAVVWRGRVIRIVSLRSARPGLRRITLATFKGERRGTLRLRTLSSRRVAIDTLLAGARGPAPARR